MFVPRSGCNRGGLRRGRRLDVHGHGQLLDVDDDALGARPRRVSALREHDRDRLAREPDDAGGEGRLWRLREPVDGDRVDERTMGEVGGREHADEPGHRACVRHVERAHTAMCDLGAHEDRLERLRGDADRR